MLSDISIILFRHFTVWTSSFFSSLFFRKSRKKETKIKERMKGIQCAVVQIYSVFSVQCYSCTLFHIVWKLCILLMV